MVKIFSEETKKKIRDSNLKEMINEEDVRRILKEELKTYDYDDSHLKEMITSSQWILRQEVKSLFIEIIDKELDSRLKETIENYKKSNYDKIEGKLSKLINDERKLKDICSNAFFKLMRNMLQKIKNKRFENEKYNLLKFIKNERETILKNMPIDSLIEEVYPNFFNKEYKDELQTNRQMD